MTTLPPIRRQVIVDCDADRAYALWADGIGSWWPLATHGCFGADGSLAVDDGRIVETASDGRQAVWGTIEAAEPGRRLAFTWHPGQDADQATAVSVEFAQIPGRAATLVTLEHSGWQRVARREDYRDGWVTVLGDLVTSASADDTGDGDVWLVLDHRPGPATPPEGVFASSDFARHAAFLRTLADAGQLVAAGPLADTAGGGMTIVRVPDLIAATEVTRAAQLDDGSVTTELLTVRVRPWNVVMHA